MKKTILITILCAILMLVTPLTSVAQENKISSNLQEEPDIDGLVAQIRTIVDEILQRYEHIPMLRNICNVILSVLDNTFGWFLYCVVFGLLVILPLGILFVLLDGLGFFNSYIGHYIRLTIFVIILMWDGTCDFPLSLFECFCDLSLNPLTTSTEINNVSELASECSCLQE